MVGSVVSKSRASVLIATLTTVTSRIDMIAPSTTTPATAITPRSRPWSAGDVAVHEAVAHEHVDRPAGGRDREPELRGQLGERRVVLGVVEHEQRADLRERE